MSDSISARRTSVQIFFDGVDITNDITPYLLSITYTDCEEDESDSLELQLQDREGLWLEHWLTEAVQATASSRLSIRATITPEYWGNDTPPLATGLFEVDSVEAQGPPSTVTIKGVSLSYGSSIRQTPKSKVWKYTSLSNIAKEIAKNAGLSCMYDAKTDPNYARKEQTKESDITFLSALCHDAGISLKCTDEQLVLFEQSIYESLSPVATIRRGGGRILPSAPEAHGAYRREQTCEAYIDYSLSTGAAESQYGSCRVSYTDPATGTYIEGIAVDDVENEQQLEVTARVSSVGEAQALAEKQLKLHNKFSHTASFTLTGNTILVAGVTVLLDGFGGWDGKYMVNQATHTLSGGYTTQVDLRKVD